MKNKKDVDYREMMSSFLDTNKIPLEEGVAAMAELIVWSYKSMGMPLEAYLHFNFEVAKRFEKLFDEEKEEK